MNQFCRLNSLLMVLALIVPRDIYSQVLSWESTGGPLGGSPTSLFVDPVGTILTATYQGTGSSLVFRSTNAGDSWAKVNLPSQQFNCFAANHTGQIFAGTSNAVYRSANGGVSWQLLSNGLQSTDVFALAVNAHDALFAGTSKGVFRSTDNGNNWSQVAMGNFFYAITIDQNGHIYAGGYYSGVWNSTDGGDTWSPTSLTSVSVASLTSTPSNEILAGLYVGGGVVRTTDGGSNWTQIGLAGVSVSSVLAKSANSIFAASPDSGLYRSTDNGTTWGQTSLLSASDLAMSPAGHIYAGVLSSGMMGSGASGGVFRSTDDGASWTKVGLPNTMIPALAIPAAGPSKDDVFAAADSVVFVSTDNGSEWSRTASLPHSGPLNFDLRSLLAGTSGTVLAGTGQWGIYRTTNRGTSWAQVGANSETIEAFLETPDGSLYAAGWSSVYVSTDGGGSWATTAGSPGGSYYTSLVRNSHGEIFVGMVNKSDSAYVCRSTDNGQHWLLTGMTSYSVMALVVTGGDTILAGCQAFYYGAGGGVYRSPDNGATWTEVSSGLINRDIHALVRNSIGHIFAATAQGVYRSTNNGDLWEMASAGLTFPYIESLALNSSGTLFAGTSSGGVYRTSQSTTSVREEGREVPSSYRLEQNFPNPFNPRTVISCQWPVVSDVQLVVYDVLGREVAVLVNERKAPGRYEVTFDASGLASGVYFCRLTAGRYVESRKMVLMK